MTLSERQVHILEFIETYLAEHDYPPTIRYSVFLRSIGTRLRGPLKTATAVRPHRRPYLQRVELPAPAA